VGSGPTLGYPTVPEYLADANEHRRQIARKLNTVLGGKVNCTLDVTLATSVTSTTVIDSRIGFYTAISPAMALTANAAADIAAGIYVDTLKKGSAVLHHRNNAATDRTIRLVIIG
jgi:hypothetical protein